MWEHFLGGKVLGISVGTSFGRKNTWSLYGIIFRGTYYLKIMWGHFAVVQGLISPLLNLLPGKTNLLRGKSCLEIDY